MIDFFKKRGYPDNVINSAEERIINITRATAVPSIGKGVTPKRLMFAPAPPS